MKKFLILGFLFLLTISQVNAMSKELGFKGPLNFFQTKLLEKIISREVKSIVGGDIKTKVESYGAKALRNGIFKSAKIVGKNLDFESISISEIEIYTTTENNRIDITDKSEPKLLTDIEGEYRARLSNEDLASILSAPICSREIDRLNNKLAPFVMVKDVNIFSQSGRLRFKLNLGSEFLGKDLPVSGSAKIRSLNGIPSFDDIVLSKKIKYGLYDKAIALLNSMNPINMVIKELDNAKLHISVNEINIVDDKIEIFGIIKVYRGV